MWHLDTSKFHFLPIPFAIVIERATSSVTDSKWGLVRSERESTHLAVR
jgi:hypothetical protein